ncbi:TPA: hypothetical protein P0E33_004876 [Vibrio harveyi]|nr:hypothetical protein [Vibrio harveyi]HDM8182927.1 hypothetical protein [Vibrio harveyi]
MKMAEDSIRYVVEQRCKTHKNHEVKLGFIPVSSKHPARDVQLLIRDVFRCPDCTFHCKFYAEEQCTLIKLGIDCINTKDLFYRRLISVIVLVLLFITSVTISFRHGITHPLSVLSISSFFCMLFSSLDAWSSEKTSKLQWAAFIVNVIMLAFSFLLLPTLEALDILNRSGVTQNFLQLFCGAIQNFLQLFWGAIQNITKHLSVIPNA